MKLVGRIARVIFLVNGCVTLLAFLTATEGCQARLPFALPLSSPSDFVADSRGHVFVHSDFHRAVTEYDAAGRFVQNLAVPGGGGRGLLAVDARDRLYVNKADLLAVFERGGRLVETHGVPPGGERSWRLLPDGTVANVPAAPAGGAPAPDGAGATATARKEDVAWTLRPRHAAVNGELLFVDWIRMRRPIGIGGRAILGDPFIGRDRRRYEYAGVFAGIVRRAAELSAEAHFRPSRLAAVYTYPHGIVVWLIVPYLALRVRRTRSRRLAAVAAAAAAGNGAPAAPGR